MELHKVVVAVASYRLRMGEYHSYLQLASEVGAEGMEAVHIQIRAVGCGTSEAVVVVGGELEVELVELEPCGGHDDGEPLSNE